MLFAAKLREKIKNKELTEEYVNILEEFRQRHPHHPETRGLLDEMLPKLLARAEQHRTSKRFDSAEEDYNLAKVWGADPRMVKQGMQAIQNSRVDAALKSGENLSDSGDFVAASRMYDYAETLGADFEIISIKRHQLNILNATYLIADNQIEKAENYILDWELSGFEGPELETLNALLN